MLLQKEKKCKIKKRGKNEIMKKKHKIDINKNIVRQISNIINKVFDFNKLRGLFYYNIHFYLIFTIGFISIFTSSIFFLIITLIIVSLDAVSIVFLHECPLTAMEKKYLGITSCDVRNEQLKNTGIMYNCDHSYEKQIELLINVWTIIATKCLSIMFLKMFDIKLFDVGNIYV